MITQLQEAVHTHLRMIKIVMAGIYSLLAAIHLFSFDTLRDAFLTLGLSGGGRTAWLLALVLVVAEVFSLPFLLSLTTSPAFRWVSRVLTLTVPLLLLIIACAENITNAGGQSVLLGDTISPPVTALSVIVMAVLSLAAVTVVLQKGKIVNEK